MKKNIVVVLCFFLMMLELNVLAESNISLHQVLNIEEVEEEIDIKEDHALVKIFKQSDDFKNFNVRMFGELDLNAIKLYKFEQNQLKAISISVRTGDRHKVRALLVCFDLQEQSQMSRVFEVVADPTDGEGNFESNDPARFTGHAQLLETSGELIFGRSFENGATVNSYGNYIMPCQGAVISMFAGTVIGGIIGGPAGFIGGYLNGLVGVLMNCCCD
ncbi:MAG: hypothetical protein HKN22_03000 [Bacteroidia bacterium]|nr:hypothetical protein [Bacteroidia bacterium]